MASIDCDICCQTLNFKNKSISCPHCKYTCCSLGIKQSLLDIEFSQNPHCPNNECKKPWSREFLMEKLTKSWFETTYRDFRKQVLIDKERSFLPVAQLEVERIKESRKKNQEKEALQIQHHDTRVNLFRLRAEVTELKVKLEIAEDKKAIKDLMTTKRAEIATCLELKRELKLKLRNFVPTITENKQERKEFVQACPHNGCKGYLSSVWHCSLCENWSCAQCGCVKGQTKDSEHKCDPNIMASFQAIKKETTTCPGCSSKVYRVQGCDQMWCTQCHTAFNYKTGKIITGRIHNPHFMEWQKGHGDEKRDTLDAQCGGTPGLYDLTKILGKIFGKKEIPVSFDKMYQVVLEVHDYLIPAYVVQRNEHTNMNLRVKYLMNEITEEKWKSQLIKNEKEYEKKEELCLVLQAYRDATNDILRKILILKTSTEYLVLFKEYQELCKFIIEGLEKVLKLYNSTQSRISAFMGRLARWVYVDDAGILRKKITTEVDYN